MKNQTMAKSPQLESEIINNKIKQLRESLGLSLSVFAKALGFTGSNSSTTAWRWEKGIRQPSKQTIILMEQLAKKHAKKISLSR